MKSQKLFISVLALSSFGCATGLSRTDRMWTGASVGLGMGAVGGSMLSPDDENRGINALVFGATGALVGGAIGYLTGADSKPSETKTLEDRERQGDNSGIQDFTISPAGDVPSFLKNRMSPAVIEEYLEQDSVGEDGALHAPHKVYRIKRPAELIARPENNSNGVKAE